MVEVRRGAARTWPTVVAKGDGEVVLRVEVGPPAACGPETAGGVLAAGSARVRVRLSEPEPRTAGQPSPPYVSRPPEPDGGWSQRSSAASERIPPAPKGDLPNVVNAPRSHSGEDDAPAPGRGLSEMEVGGFVLLGVFCLAVLVFLVNGGSYVYRRRRRRTTTETPAVMSHAHDWVWLGQEEGLRPRPQEDGGQLLPGPRGRVDSLNSPTTKRSRVKFTTFSSTAARPGPGGGASGPERPDSEVPRV